MWNRCEGHDLPIAHSFYELAVENILAYKWQKMRGQE
jgi:hypothetical protein